jgi:hypothetical protein
LVAYLRAALRTCRGFSPNTRSDFEAEGQANQLKLAIVGNFDAKQQNNLNTVLADIYKVQSGVLRAM